MSKSRLPFWSTIMFNPCMCAVMTFPVCVCVCVCVCISLSLCICLRCCLLCVWGLGCSSLASNDILLSHSCHSRSGFPLVCTSGSTQCGSWPGPARAFLTHFQHAHTHTVHTPSGGLSPTPTANLTHTASRSPTLLHPSVSIVLS